MRYSPSIVTQKKAASYADLEALPSNLVGEIIDGELIASPRPAFVHAVVASRLAIDLGGPFDRGKGGPGGWIVVHEPELHIVDQVLVPDLAGWRRERVPEIPDVAAVGLPPDWLCEVLSPSTAKIDRSRKMRHYAAADVRHVWLVDPLATTLEIYRLDSKGWRLIDTHAGDAVIRAEPFDAVELDLAALWRR
jgi:Uma2 family endonuclease